VNEKTRYRAALAYALAGALLASSADALPDGLPTGTYYEPGKYPREATVNDTSVRMHGETLPPLQYDHPYAGHLFVVDAGDEEMQKWCPLGSVACARPDFPFAGKSPCLQDCGDGDISFGCVIFHARKEICL
jgi:hypothetical protein